jgi:hypothetical protein
MTILLHVHYHRLHFLPSEKTRIFAPCIALTQRNEETKKEKRRKKRKKIKKRKKKKKKEKKKK